ncbi:MAG: hypothetical protein LBC20_08100 [Planctomycetaceae bacterium]|jgi:hypothetical protein|nr:hypothetical protein [Planctomycetaceae bacterium]
MRKKTKPQGLLGLIHTHDLDQYLNRLLENCLLTVTPKRLRRLLGTAALITLVSVNLGGGGPFREYLRS